MVTAEHVSAETIEVRTRISPENIFNNLQPPAGSAGSRFSDRGGSRGGFNDRRGNGNMDRRGGGGNGGMRDYVDPWAHNGSSGNSPMMGGSGPLNNFSLGNGNNNGMGNMSLVNNAAPNNGNNGGGFGGSNMEIDKTSTQVTIPKDVRHQLAFQPKGSPLLCRFLYSWPGPSSAKEAVAFDASVRSRTHSFRSMKLCRALQIELLPSPEHQNRSKPRNTCFSRGE